ncbi:MAG: hypothetical protein JW715_02230 [Sedimentisphaerales bacterium]|nr:hypothetical protein [Sedimentisphaerales bacterium]
MKKLSRWMPSRPVYKTPPWAYPFIILLLAGAIALLFFIGYCLYKIPELLLVILFVVFLFWQHIEKFRYSMRNWAQSRSGENICSFVRAFDFRHTDTWILRAVYEELGMYLEIDGRPFPVRADDRWEEDLQIDPDDMEWDIFPDIAHRACRSIENTEQNPFYDRVKTVRDLVNFLEHQPKLQSRKQIN